ncbi:MAG: hypothetical protein QXW71_00075 [Thermoplasmata archaeon]
MSINSIKKGILQGLEEINNSETTALAEKPNIELFDYSAVDEDTALFLQEKAQRIREIRVKSVILIGKELSETFDKLSKVDYGEKTKTFESWVQSIGISSRHARRYIESYKYIEQNFLNIEDAEKIQPSLLFEISKPSAPKELEQMVLSGDIKSHKEYKELEQKLKQERDRARIAEQKLTQMLQQQKTIETVEIIPDFMKETLSKRICETLDFISSLTIEEISIIKDRAADLIYKAKQKLDQLYNVLKGGE